MRPSFQPSITPGENVERVQQMTKRCRCFTFIAVTCIPFVHLATAADDATMIARPSDGITIAAADYGFYNFHVFW